MSRAVIVCGGRDYLDREHVFAVMDEEHTQNPITLLMHGGAPGADRLAYEWAIVNHIGTREYAARWGKHGRAAGPLRNERMAKAGAHLCIAFPGGPGTRSMTELAQRHNIPTRIEARRIKA